MPEDLVRTKPDNDASWKINTSNRTVYTTSSYQTLNQWTPIFKESRKLDCRNWVGYQESGGKLQFINKNIIISYKITKTDNPMCCIALFV